MLTRAPSWPRRIMKKLWLLFETALAFATIELPNGILAASRWVSEDGACKMEAERLGRRA